MTDYFALLDVPRRPWLDPQTLRLKFINLSAVFHPDRTHGDEPQERSAHDRYTQLNSAYNCLRNPKARLAHLIEMEKGVKPSELQSVPSDLMEVFMEVGTACKKVDRFLTKKSATNSHLLRVQLFGHGQELSDEMAEIQARLTAFREELLRKLQRLDADWEHANSSGRSELLDNLEEIRRLLGFFDRWISQVQERFVQLAL